MSHHSFRPWAVDLLDRVRLTPEERVLDVACGTGIVARLAREQLGAGSQKTGVDVNPEMKAVARSIESGVSWHLGNALELPFEDGSFNVVLCQRGLQFFSDRAAAAREMRRILADGGRIILRTWRPLEENPLFRGLDNAAACQFGSRSDRRFSLGDARTICTFLVQ